MEALVFCNEYIYFLYDKWNYHKNIDSGPPPAVEMQGIQGEQQTGLVASDGRYGEVVFQSQ